MFTQLLYCGIFAMVPWAGWQYVIGQQFLHGTADDAMRELYLIFFIRRGQWATEIFSH